MSLKKEIFSISNKIINNKSYKEIKILGIRLRFKSNLSRPYKFKVNSKYLSNKSKLDPFKYDDDMNDLYTYFLNSNDKSIDKMHHYFHIYNNHFEKFRNKPVNILEIGVCKGGSLRMWKKYFGEKCHIYGVDIDPACKQYEDLENNIHIMIADQGNLKSMQDLMKQLPQIDILIEDGGHTTNQQITTFEACYDKISDLGGGIFGRRFAY